MIWRTARPRRPASDASATTTRGYFHHEPKGEGEDPQQTRYITWPGQEAEKNQSLILQPVAGNSKSRKMKGKTETRHGVKERATSMTALKMITRQGADEKS